MGYLSNINSFSGSNIGGILVLQVARASDIDTIPDPVSGVVYGDILFKPGKAFVTWRVTHETASTKSTGKKSREGTSKSNSLPFYIPKDRAVIRAMLDIASDDELIVLFQDANGNYKLFGLKDSPVRFEYTASSGSKTADSNHYECNFFYDGPDNMYEYNGAVSTAPAGSAPAIVRVNGVVIASLLPGEIIDFNTDFTFDFAIVGT